MDMQNQNPQISPDFHAGVIGFLEKTKLTDIIKAAKDLSKTDAFQNVWIRRISRDSWGIEFLLRCNSHCREKDITSEIEYWLSKIRMIIPSQNICSYDIGGGVILIKPLSL